jgi:hypothetical protein
MRIKISDGREDKRSVPVRGLVMTALEGFERR